ncbi:hypothetical protein Dimus_037754, partial [Dionaea muscipula]
KVPTNGASNAMIQRSDLMQLHPHARVRQVPKGRCPFDWFFCSFFKASSYGGIFHCSTCAIGLDLDRGRMVFGYVRDKRGLMPLGRALLPSGRITLALKHSGNDPNLWASLAQSSDFADAMFDLSLAISTSARVSSTNSICYPENHPNMLIGGVS